MGNTNVLHAASLADVVAVTVAALLFGIDAVTAQAVSVIAHQ